MIRLAELSDIPSLVSLSEQAFGKSFHNDSYFNSAISSSKNRCYINLYNDVLVAFLTILNTENGLRIDSVVVDETHRGKGMASQLFEEVLTDYNSERLQVFVWKESPDGNLEAICQRFGFNKVDEISNYWYEQSLNNEFICKRCGNPCYCTAILYEK